MLTECVELQTMGLVGFLRAFLCCYLPKPTVLEEEKGETNPKLFIELLKYLYIKVTKQVKV